MNQSTVSGKWKEIKGEFLKTWGKVSGDEADRTQGNVESLAGLLEQKYGIAKEEGTKKLKEMFARFEGASSDAANAKIDTAKEQLKN
jgi:uncharacterized protein YjbJ (UPF0337 family)